MKKLTWAMALLVGGVTLSAMTSCSKDKDEPASTPNKEVVLEANEYRVTGYTLVRGDKDPATDKDLINYEVKSGDSTYKATSLIFDHMFSIGTPEKATIVDGKVKLIGTKEGASLDLEIQNGTTLFFPVPQSPMGGYRLGSATVAEKEATLHFTQAGPYITGFGFFAQDPKVRAAINAFSQSLPDGYVLDVKLAR